MHRRSGWTVMVCAALSALPVGCAQSPRPLTADLFAPPGLVEPARLGNLPTDSSSVSADISSPTKAVILTPLQPQMMGSIQPLEALDAAATSQPVEPQAQPASAVIAPVQNPDSTALLSSPAPVPGTSSGVYMTVGALIATVDGTPIYSSQILRRLEKQFAAKARDLSEGQFRSFARHEINRQLNELIQDEIIFHDALNHLTAQDRETAELWTIHIKQQRITAAGGSLEAAKARAAAEGQDFDDEMKQAYREVVYEAVQQRIIEPMVQITRADQYAFYQKNLAKLYSQKSKVLFRVIEIDPATLTGGDTDKLASDKITALHDRAARGEEFIAMASAENSDSYLRAHGGDPGGWMENNTYRVDEVEKAVWQLDIGGVTPVIKSNGIYYIAKLFDKKIGSVRPFDADVQTDIYNQLRAQQIAERRHFTEEELQSRADMVSPDDVNKLEDRMELAVDLAMQKYREQNASVTAKVLSAGAGQ